jgi:hypothetical protein
MALFASATQSFGGDAVFAGKSIFCRNGDHSFGSEMLAVWENCDGDPFSQPPPKKKTTAVLKDESLFSKAKRYKLNIFPLTSLKEYSLKDAL